MVTCIAPSPSAPVWLCGALPQPRSKSTTAAETRALSFFEFLTMPASALITGLVCARASDLRSAGSRFLGKGLRGQSPPPANFRSRRPRRRFAAPYLRRSALSSLMTLASLACSSITAAGPGSRYQNAVFRRPKSSSSWAFYAWPPYPLFDGTIATNGPGRVPGLQSERPCLDAARPLFVFCGRRFAVCRARPLTERQ